MSNSVILSKKSKKLSTYSQLRSAVRAEIRLGRTRAERAVAREKVRTSWQIGKLIHEHVLLKKDRAKYGGQVLKRLSKDLQINLRDLQYMVEFAKAYPIVRPVAQLSWSHYQRLLAVNDKRTRDALAKRAEKSGWTRNELSAEIKKIKASRSTVIASTWSSIHSDKEQDTRQSRDPKPGVPGTYEIIKDKAGAHKGKLVYDLGFSNYYKPARALKRIKKPATSKLYTYEAEVTKIIDGDTFWARIDLGFGITTEQKLRLRGLNAPEVISTEGRQAKNFLEGLLAGTHSSISPSLRGSRRGGRRGNLSLSSSGLTRGSRKKRESSKLLIKTQKSDKYDRYLADVWVGNLYINNELINHGFASKV